jgi:hypothetical protein
VVDVEPFAHDRRPYIGLVLMIGIDDLDLDVLAAAAKILRRHTRGFHRAHAVGVLEDAGNIVEHADANDIVGNFGAGRAASGAGQSGCEIDLEPPHGSPSFSARRRCRRVHIKSVVPAGAGRDRRAPPPV